MRKHTWRLVAGTLAPTKWAIVPAALYGLVHGATLLGKSVDLATALGIAGLISLAIGPWLAVTLDRLLMRGYAAWVAAIVGRLANMDPPMSPSEEPDLQAHAGPMRIDMATRAVGYSFYATIFCFGGLTTGALLTITTAQIQGVNHGYYLVATAAMFVALLITMTAQCFYFGIMHRKAGLIVARHIPADGQVQGFLSVAIQAANLFDSIARTEKFGCRLVGAQPISMK